MVRIRFRDALRKLLPWWLSDRTGTGPGVNVGYRFLWAIVAMLDTFVEFAMEGLQARYPGIGTDTALEKIGRSRGVIRGRVETNASYQARLRLWLDFWRDAGSQHAVARCVRDYLGPVAVRVVNRSGVWTSIAVDGTVTVTSAAFDWDSVSNPERNNPAAPWFWDLWVIVQPTPYAHRAGTLGSGDVIGDDGYGLGHQVPHREREALRGELAQWKSQGAHIRALIFTTDPALFDPAVPASLPNGTWGTWSNNGAAGGRNVTSCRYWEFV